MNEPPDTHEHRHRLLGEMLTEYKAIHGPLPQELLDQAARAWPDYEKDEIEGDASTH